MSRRIVIGVLTALLAGLLAMPTASKAATSFSPVADTYVDAANPATNYGTKTYLRADGSPLQRSFLRFNVQGVGNPGSAVLRFYAETGSTAGIEVHKVSATDWNEKTITNNNAPVIGDVLGSTEGFSAGTWLSVNVSAAVTGDGLVSFALTTPGGTAVRLTSREGANRPELVAPAPSGPSPYVVTRTGSSSTSYRAVSVTTGTTFTGTAKSVVEQAVADLERSGGGMVRFDAGTFELGSEYFLLKDVFDIQFVGAGMTATIIRNSSSAAADTEPFNYSDADRVVVRDLTVSAGGPARSTSDALDFDGGNDVTVERVKVIASRGRGIVFDGKDHVRTADRNKVLNCEIDGTFSDGIELLASSYNTVQGCTITRVGGHGIQLAKASSGATQANKKSSDNVISGNKVDQAGQDGINVTSGDRNKILGNVVTNSSNIQSGRDGIRLTASDSITCDGNQVAGNTATDNQSQKTQMYGLNINSSLCNKTVIGPENKFDGNLAGQIRDRGTGTTQG